jgi:hypothetical protein
LETDGWNFPPKERILSIISLRTTECVPVIAILIPNKQFDFLKAEEDSSSSSSSLLFLDFLGAKF